MIKEILRKKQIIYTKDKRTKNQWKNERKSETDKVLEQERVCEMNAEGYISCNNLSARNRLCKFVSVLLLMDERMLVALYSFTPFKGCVLFCFALLLLLLLKAICNTHMQSTLDTTLNVVEIIFSSYLEHMPIKFMFILYFKL